MLASVWPRPGRRPDPALHQLWQQRLDRFAQSGLSAAAFCVQQRLSVHSFYAWRRRLRQLTTPPRRAATPRLLPVRLTAAAPVEVALPSGPVLRLLPGCDLDFVRSLVASLEDAPC